MAIEDLILGVSVVLPFSILAFYIRMRLEGGRYLVFWGFSHLLAAINYGSQYLLQFSTAPDLASRFPIPINGIFPILAVAVVVLILLGVFELCVRQLEATEMALALLAPIVTVALTVILSPRIGVFCAIAIIIVTLNSAAFLLWRANQTFYRFAAIGLILRAGSAIYIGYLQALTDGTIVVPTTFLITFTLISSLALLIVALGEEHQKKVAETAAVDKTRELMQKILDAVPAGIAFKTPDLRYAFVNKAMIENYGNPRKLVGMTSTEVFGEERNKPHAAQERALLESGGDIAHNNFYDSDSDQSFVVTRQVLRDSSQQMIGLVTVGIDVSDQERSLRRLQRAQQLARAGWFEYTAKDDKLRIDATMIDTLGLPVTRPFSLEAFFSSIEAEDAEAFRQISQQAIREHRAYYFDAWFTNPSHRRFWLHIEAVPKYDPAGAYVGSEGFIQDLTGIKQREDALKQKELELVRSQRVESIGRLADGIAHDFNNILAAISGFAELIRQDAPSGSSIATFVDRISRSADRGRQVVRQILAYARASSVERTVIDLATVIEDVTGLARATIPTSTSLSVHCDPGPLHVRANEGQVHQIILNLCLNSNDALSGRTGSVDVQVSRLKAEDGKAHMLCSAGPSASGGGVIGIGEILPEKTYVHIQVKDNGHGMTWAVLQRWDEPFFTTKELGRGTGLGLPIVKGIVTAYGGAMCLESTPGAGTTVSIYIPMEDTLTLPTDSQLGSNTGIGHRGRIVVVDDEADVRDVVTIALQRAGHSVTSFGDPLEALNHFHIKANAADILITDHIMPGLKGMDLIAEARGVSPGLRTILCTGFGDKTTERSALDAGVDRFFEKPVSGRDLVEAVQTLLESTAAGLQAR